MGEKSKPLIDELLEALDMKGYQLAEAAGIRPEHIYDLRDRENSTELDPTWLDVYDYVNKRVGRLIAIREIIMRKTAKENARRMALRQRMRGA